MGAALAGLGRAETDYWRRYLSGVPTWALELALDCQGSERAQGPDPFVRTAIEVDDLLVDPEMSRVVWRGGTYALRGRPMEVVYTLAVLWFQGRRRPSTTALACKIWRGWDAPTARNNLRPAIVLVRRAIPDLIAHEIGVGYFLNVDRGAVARRVA